MGSASPITGTHTKKGRSSLVLISSIRGVGSVARFTRRNP